MQVVVCFILYCRLRPGRTAQQGRLSTRWWRRRGPMLRGEAGAAAHARATDTRTSHMRARYGRLRRRASVGVRPGFKSCKECKECKEVQRPGSSAPSVPAVRFVRKVSNVRLALPDSPADVPAVRFVRNVSKACVDACPSPDVPAVRFVRNVSNVRLALGCCPWSLLRCAFQPQVKSLYRM